MMKKILLYSIFVLTLLVIMYKIWPLPFFTFSKTVLLPSVNALTLMTQKIISPIELVKNIGKLDRRNKELENENRSLKSTIALLEDKIKNSEILSSEIEKSKNFKRPIQAKVIGRSPGGLNSTLLLDKGSNDGVNLSDAVLSSGYFIGKVKSVEANKSEVVLVFSHSSLVPVVMSKNNEGGLLQGGLEGLTVTDIPISSKIEAGDDIITSGLGGDLPSGLIVGKVGAHLGMEGDLFQKIRVNSPVNPFRVNYVTVVAK